MPTYNDSIDQSLTLLYGCSPNFKISIDLIQKLAQFLKLETFIDTEMLTDPELSAQLSGGSKRLSIAGSLILVDIDFLGNDKVSRVSLSSGNHSPGTSGIDADLTQYASKYSFKGADNIVRINFLRAKDLSFLKTKLGESTVAESILLNSLKGDVMGNFPVNLKYLTDLDSISPLDGDLIVYLDNIALYLNAIHATEISLRPDAEAIRDGWQSLFGKIHLNDVETLRLGVFLHFWKDSRKMEQFLLKNECHSYNSRIHKALLKIEKSTCSPVDVLQDASGEIWSLRTDQDTLQPLKFFFEENTHLHNRQSVSKPSDQGWNLTLTLDCPVYIPTSVLEFLGLTNLCAASNPQNKEVFSLIMENGYVSLSAESNEESYSVKFVVDDPSEMIPVESFELLRLSQLARMVPVIRNFLVFTNLINNVMQTHNARILTPIKESYDAAKRLRDSLNLSHGVTEKELFNLNSLNPAANMEYLSFNSDTDLSSFAKQGEQTPEYSIGSEQAYEEVDEDSRLTIRLEDVELDSADFDMVFMVSGKTRGSERALDTKFRIRNGEIAFIPSGQDVSIDATSFDANQEFIQALTTSEDPLLAFHIVEGIQT